MSHPSTTPPTTTPLRIPPTLDLAAMRTHADQVVGMLKLLGNADRLILLCQLAAQERTVGDLERVTGIHQPSLSQQLAILRRDGVVDTRREGKYIWYRLVDERVLVLMHNLQEVFCPSEHCDPIPPQLP